MGSRVFLGIDIGSARVRAGLFDATGTRLAFAVRPIKQFHPRPLYVEQSSADIWSQACAAVREAVAAAQIAPAQVAGIGVDATCSLVAVGAMLPGCWLNEGGQSAPAAVSLLCRRPRPSTTPSTQSICNSTTTCCATARRCRPGARRLLQPASERLFPVTGRRARCQTTRFISTGLCNER